MAEYRRLHHIFKVWPNPINLGVVQMHQMVHGMNSLRADFVIRVFTTSTYATRLTCCKTYRGTGRGCLT